MLSQLQRPGISSPACLRAGAAAARFQAGRLGRFVQHYLGIQEMIGTVGLGGKLVTPQEVRELYQREHQELATAAVFFSASNYLARVTMPPDAIDQFYTNRLATYRIPDRVQVSYVKFELTNFLGRGQPGAGPSMTNLDLQIDEAYRQGGTNFLRELRRGLAGGGAQETPRRSGCKEFQAQFARKKAGEFANPLFDMEPVRVGELGQGGQGTGADCARHRAV